MISFDCVKRKIKAKFFIAWAVMLVLICNAIFGEAVIYSNNYIIANANNNNFAYNNLPQVQYTDTLKVVEVSMAITPTRLIYNSGDYLDMSGLILKVGYSNHTYENVVYNAMNASDFKFLPDLNTPLNANDSYVTIVYKDGLTVCPITVIGPPIISSNTNGSNRTTRSNGDGTRTGKVIDRNNKNTENEDTLNAMLLYMLAVNAYNTNANTNPYANVNPYVNVNPYANVTPSVNLYGGYNLQNQQPTIPYIYSSNNARPEAVTNYINSNPLLTYSYNNNDGSYTFSNGMTIYPNGIMKDNLGTTYNTDGSATTEDGFIKYANGSIRDSSGNIYNLDGTISLPGNAYVDTSGITHYGDGSVKLADGTVYNIDGSIDFPNGTVLTGSGRVIKRTKKAVETEEKEKHKDAWRYDPVANKWQLEPADQTTPYFK